MEQEIDSRNEEGDEKRKQKRKREKEEERKKETVNKFMGKVKSIASSAVQRVAPSAFIFHFSFTTSPFGHHQLLLALPL